MRDAYDSRHESALWQVVLYTAGGMVVSLPFLAHKRWAPLVASRGGA